ncbi:ABC transporter ATP-binding protein [Promicromonospora iranensis]|jgi:ABC-2 type transport system ATP-binding protein|uniref:ABC transporter ATP-binding protein n=1 Tax=Promicromonospora iranensis TaxID=1105144 RepID=UPI0023AA0D66|nr:ATP-binding cassette domain-containing protein [Promicromonospora iranensis]
MITFDHVTKRYGATLALDDVSFEVPASSITGFLGPNGAGKTTAMRILLGHSRSSGRATIDGQQYAEISNPGGTVGALLDAQAVHPGRTGAETLAVAAAMIGVDRRRIGQVLDLVGLSVAESRRTVKGYSLGMRQRLGIAQALLGTPKALVLDEPANGLDPQGIRAIRDLLRAVADDGCAVLLSSHLLHEVAQLADRVVIIGRGRILDDTPIDHSTAQDLESRYFALTSTDDRSAA